MLTTPEATELWPNLGSVTTSSFPELAAGRKSLAETFGPTTASLPNRRLIKVSESESVDELFDEDDVEAAARPPEFRPDYGAAIAQALNQQAILNSVTGGANRKNGQKQKKKKASTVLFSTNVRSYNGN